MGLFQGKQKGQCGRGVPGPGGEGPPALWSFSGAQGCLLQTRTPGQRSGSSALPCRVLPFPRQVLWEAQEAPEWTCPWARPACLPPGWERGSSNRSRPAVEAGPRPGQPRGDCAQSSPQPGPGLEGPGEGAQALP